MSGTEKGAQEAPELGTTTTEGEVESREEWTNPVWMVRTSAAAKAVGPLALDQIRDGIQRRTLDAEAEVAPLGSDEWRPAQVALQEAVDRAGQSMPPRRPGGTLELPHVQDGAAPPLPPPRPPPPQAPPSPAAAPKPATEGAAVPSQPKRKPPPWVFAAIGGAALLFLGGGGIGLCVLLGGDDEPKAVIPDIVRRLPGQTSAVQEARIRPNLDELSTLPDPFVASALARIACGGTDVVEVLRDARGKSQLELHKLGVFGLTFDKELSQRLRCGDVVRSTLLLPSFTNVVFTEEEKQHTVHLLRSKMEAIPESAHLIPHNFSGLPGQCTKPKDGDGCAKGEHAAFHDKDLWVTGKLEAVEGFGRAYTTAHDEVTTNVEILEKLGRFRRGSDVTLLLARPRKIPWTSPCEQAAPLDHRKEFVRACFPRGQERVLESIETKVRGLVIERDIVAAASRIRWSFRLLARDDDAAESIEKDLMDLRRDWRAHLLNHEPKLVRLLQSSSKNAHDRMWDTVVEPFLRGVRSMKIERDGSVVHLEIDEEFRENEVKQLKEGLQRRAEDHHAALEVVKALLDGKPVPAKSLGFFVGKPVASWISTPRATAKDCEEIGEEIKALVPEPLPPAKSGLKAELEKRFANKRCVGLALPASYRSCFKKASSLDEAAACAPPPSPFEQAARAKLLGNWNVSSVDITNAEKAPAGSVENFQQCKLDVGKERVALQCGHFRADGKTRVSAPGPTRTRLGIPTNKALEDKAVVFDDADTMTLQDMVPGVQVKFKRAKKSESGDASAKPGPKK